MIPLNMWYRRELGEPLNGETSLREMTIPPVDKHVDSGRLALYTINVEISFPRLPYASRVAGVGNQPQVLIINGIFA